MGVVLAISLPAFGSAMTGIAGHLQYQRHKAVYAGMARQLRAVKQRIEHAPSRATLRQGAADADRVMASEQRDWLGVMKFLDLDLG